MEPQPTAHIHTLPADQDQLAAVWAYIMTKHPYRIHFGQEEAVPYILIAAAAHKRVTNNMDSSLLKTASCKLVRSLTEDSSMVVFGFES